MTKLRTLPAALLAGAATVVLLAACSGSGGASPGTTGGTTAPGPRPSSTAKLAIVSPKDGQTFTSATIPVSVSLQDAKIVPTTSTNLKPNEGHLHLYLDGKIVSMNYQTTDMLHKVPPGMHLLRVEYVATDHAPFDPRVFAQVTFEVQQP
jgi:hypothetical protein